MAKKKELRLVDLDDKELIRKFTTCVRESWKVFDANGIVDGGRCPEYQRELAVKRELLRRLGAEPRPSREKMRTSITEEDRSEGGGLFSGGGGQGGGMFSRG